MYKKNSATAYPSSGIQELDSLEIECVYGADNSAWDDFWYNVGYEAAEAAKAAASFARDALNSWGDAAIEQGMKDLESQGTEGHTE